MDEKEIKPLEIKDSILVEGVTEDFIWYETERLRLKMDEWLVRFEKLVNVMEARQKEQTKMLDQVLTENRALKNKLKERNT